MNFKVHIGSLGTFFAFAKSLFSSSSSLFFHLSDSVLDQIHCTIRESMCMCVFSWISFRSSLFRTAAVVHFGLRHTFVCSCLSLPASVMLDLIPYWPLYTLSIWIFNTHSHCQYPRSAPQTCCRTVGIRHSRIFMYIYPFWADPNISPDFFPSSSSSSFPLHSEHISDRLFCDAIRRFAPVYTKVHYSGAFRLFFDYLAYDDCNGSGRTGDVFLSCSPLLSMMHIRQWYFLSFVFFFGSFKSLVVASLGSRLSKSSILVTAYTRIQTE